jgi:hypothetical protein
MQDAELAEFLQRVLQGVWCFQLRPRLLLTMSTGDDKVPS